MGTSMQVYGTKEELQATAVRFKTALRGGDKLNNNELIALAQISNITGLNPFIGELWYIPGKGPMIGIAGARRLWNEKSANGGGWSSVTIVPCSGEEAGYSGDAKDLQAAFRAEANDSGATAQYQKMFTETIAVMRASGSADPFRDAKEICGPRPMWVGYGYSTISETSRMNKTQLARKRAEADALKKCINVPFGAEIATETDAAPAYIEGHATTITDPQELAGEESQVVKDAHDEDYQDYVEAEKDLLPNSSEELKKIFAKEYNAASKVVKGKLPSISPTAKPDEIKEAIVGIRAAVAAA